MVGSLVASSAALLAAHGVARGSFGLFCLAILLMGSNGAFAQQYRFAASESVEPRFYAGRAVSFVLLGSILAGYFGPELAKGTKDWLGAGAYIGPVCEPCPGLWLRDCRAVFFSRMSRHARSTRPVRSVHLRRSLANLLSWWRYWRAPCPTAR